LRDLRDPTAAVFQEITRARMRLGTIRIEPMADGHTIELARSYPSHPIADALGLPTGALSPVAQLKLHVDEASLDVEV
jgi:hypothetical protein